MHYRRRRHQHGHCSWEWSYGHLAIRLRLLHWLVWPTRKQKQTGKRSETARECCDAHQQRQMWMGSEHSYADPEQQGQRP